jgi:phosphonate transport system permease protein
MKSQFFKRTIFDSIIFAYLAAVALIALAQPSEAQLLNLSYNSLVVLALLVGGAILSFALNQQNIKTLGELIFEPAYKKAASPEKSWYKTFWGWQLLIAFVTTFVVGTKSHGLKLLRAHQ